MKSYDQWFREKVQEALNDPRPLIPHEQAMKEIRGKLDKKFSNKTRMNISVSSPHLSREKAEDFREDFLQPYLDRISSGELFLVEDEIKLINLQYVVRILISSSQYELDL